jgi:hypothetical protein
MIFVRGVKKKGEAGTGKSGNRNQVHIYNNNNNNIYIYIYIYVYIFVNGVICFLMKLLNAYSYKKNRKKNQENETFVDYEVIIKQLKEINDGKNG